MNESERRVYDYILAAADLASYTPASVYGDMEMESRMLGPTELRTDVVSSENGRNNESLAKLIAEIIESTMPTRDVPGSEYYGEFVTSRKTEYVRQKRRKQEVKQTEEELSVGDTSSLDDFMGGFTVTKG